MNRLTQTHGTWGERMATFRWDGGLVTILWLKPYSRCSYHYHNTAYNRFTVISGKLKVKTEKGHTTILLPRQQFDCEPSLLHEFQTDSEPTIIEEIAFVRYDESDIVRDTLGSTIEPYPYACPKCGCAAAKLETLDGYLQCTGYDCRYRGRVEEFVGNIPNKASENS